MFPGLWPDFFHRGEPYPLRVPTRECRAPLRHTPSAASTDPGFWALLFLLLFSRLLDLGEDFLFFLLRSRLERLISSFSFFFPPHAAHG